MKVLVVDDDVFKCIAIIRTLKSHGYDCDDAKTQENALELIEQNQYDFIVSDMQYPLTSQGDIVVNAGEILAEKVNLPVIICSSQKYISEYAIGTIHYIEDNDLWNDFKPLIDEIEAIQITKE